MEKAVTLAQLERKIEHGRGNKLLGALEIGEALKEINEGNHYLEIYNHFQGFYLLIHSEHNP